MLRFGVYMIGGVWVVVILAVGAIVYFSPAFHKKKTSGIYGEGPRYICPVCGFSFFTREIVDNVVMLPCGHMFKHKNETSNTGSR